MSGAPVPIADRLLAAEKIGRQMACLEEHWSTPSMVVVGGRVMREVTEILVEHRVFPSPYQLQVLGELYVVGLDSLAAVVVMIVGGRS